MPTEAIEPKGKELTLKALLDKPATIERLAKIAPKHLSPDRLVRIMLLSFNRDSKLWRCTPQSLLAALMRCAQAGLEPDGRLVHLIPFGTDVQIIIDWKGLVEVARRNGVEAVAQLVFERDEFYFLPDDGTGRCFLKHEIKNFGDRGKLIGAYSRSKRIDGTGSIDYEWMSLPEIEAIRKRSAASKDGPWVTDFNEMARKTVLRRHSKRWPLCAEDRVAIEDDDARDDVRNATITVEAAEPKQPLFARRSIAESDDDDVPYIDQPREEPPKQERKERKAKPEAKTEPPKTEELPAEKPKEEASLQDQVQAFVEVDHQTTFKVFQAVMKEINFLPDVDECESFKDLDDVEALRVLKARRGLAPLFENKKTEPGK